MKGLSLQTLVVLVAAIAFSPPGAVLVVAQSSIALVDGQPKITIMDASTCAETRNITNSVLVNPVKDLVYINSTVFAAATNRQVAIFSWTSSSLIGSFTTGHTEEIRDMAYFEASGDRMIVTCGIDNTCRVFKLSGTSGTLQQVFRSHTADVNAVTALSNGRIATGSDDTTVKVWDHETGSCSQDYNVQLVVEAVAQISSNLLAIGRRGLLDIWIWCFTNNTFIKELDVSSSVRSIHLVSEGFMVVGTEDGRTRLFDWVSATSTNFQTNAVNNHVTDTVVTSAMLVVSTSQTSNTINVRNVTGLNISAGSTVCAKTFSNNLESVIARNPAQINFGVTPATSGDLTDLVAIGDLWNRVMIVNARTCRQIATISHSNLTAIITGLKFINSTTFAGVSGGRIVFYGSQSQTMLYYFETSHTGILLDMAYWQSATTGEQFIVTCSNDLTCRVIKWSGSTWTLQQVFRSHTGAVNTVIVLSNGRIASGSDDRTVKVWDHVTGSFSQDYDAGDPVYALAQISSTLLAVGRGGGNVHVWCFTDNTFIRNLQAGPSTIVRAIHVVSESFIAVGTDGANTRLFNWLDASRTSYQTNFAYITGTVVSSSMLVVSTSPASRWIKVRDVTGLNIENGNDVCTQEFASGLYSVEALSPKRIDFGVTPVTSGDLTDLVVIGDESREAMIVNARTCKTIATISHSNLTVRIRGLTLIDSTTFAGLSGRRVVFYSSESQTMLYYFETGHTEDIIDMAYWRSSTGEQIIVTGSFDNQCRVFRWSGSAWTQLGLYSTIHTEDVNAVIFLSTGQVATGSNDNTAKIWNYATGAVVYTFSYEGHDVYAIAQISPNTLAIGRSHTSLWIWCFTNNTLIKLIGVDDWVLAVEVVTASVVAVGTSGDRTYLVDWVAGTSNRYLTNSADVHEVAITNSRLVVSTSMASARIIVRDITGMDISSGSDVCTRDFSSILFSVVPLSPIVLDFTTTTTTTTSTSTTTTSTSTTTTSTTTTTTSTTTTTTSTSTTTTSTTTTVSTSSTLTTPTTIVTSSASTSVTTSISTTTLSTTTATTATVTAPTIVTNVDELLASLPSGPIDFSQLTPSQTVSLLASGLDVGDCLINCSSQGACGVSNGQLVCTCYGDYAGPACSLNLNPCSSFPCLNNGTCLITGNYTAPQDPNNASSLYSCECQGEFYHGTNCELKVNLCHNVTCSGHGKCQDLGTSTKCNCFYLYSGTDCEIESTKKATIQTVVSIASVLAFVMIAMFYMVFILLDLSKLLMWIIDGNGFGRKPRVKVTKKFVYTP